jgi:hypothetical protein
MNRTLILRVAAGAACLAAAALTLQSIYTAPATARRLRRKAADLELLRGLAADQVRNAAAIAMFEALPSKTPPPLGELVNTAVPGARYNLRLKESRPAQAGWSVRSIEISFEELKLSDLATFLERAENKRPPWRLVECSLTASGESPGRGRAVLVLEGLEKTGGH